MSQPEFILEESEKMSLSESHLASIIQGLLDLEVDSVVLSKEVCKLEDFSIRIGESCRVLRLSLQELD